MISRLAIKQYLNRKLCDSERAKEFTDQVLDRKLARLDPVPRFHTTPRTHQKVCFLLGVKHPGYLHLLDMGLGKTWIALNLLRYWLRAGRIRRALVLVPNTTNIAAWQEEAARHTPKLRVVGLDGDRENRLEQLDTDAQVCVMTYMGLLSLICKRVKARRKGKGKRKLKVDPKLVRRYAHWFDGVVLDESTAVKNSRSLTFRAVDQVSKRAFCRYALTGTPFGRDPADFWSQFYLMDRGDTFGETLGLFREVFFTASENYWSGGLTWEFDKRTSKLFNRFLRHRSIRYGEDECPDLPPKTYSVRPVVFPTETWTYYKKLLEDLRAAHIATAAKQYTLMKNAYIRMRQLASGFLTMKDADEERVQIIFPENPKVDALLELLDEIPPDRKAIVFHEYRTSGKIITDALADKGIRHVHILGGQASKNRRAMEQFKTRDKVRVLVSSTAGAYGLNLQVANYVIFYESPSSPILRRQMEKRAHRTGQERPVFYWDLYVKGSVEEKQLEYLREGKDLFLELVEGRAREADGIDRMGQR